MSNSEPVIFELNGIKFRLRALKTVDALKGLDILSGKLLPVVSLAFTQDGIDESAFFSNLGKASAALPEVFELFVGACDVEKNGGFVELKLFKDVAFARRPTLLLAWLSHCLSVEYADFFDEAGHNLLKETGNRWMSLFSSIGGSGE